MDKRYCVVKNTTTVIDGSINAVEIMLQNAVNAGLVETEIEILTEEEYRQRLAENPVETPKPQPQILQETVDQLVLDSLGV